MGAAAGLVGISLISSIGSSIFGALKKPKSPSAPPAISRNDAAMAAARSDEFRRRRGAGANEITGGAEASSGGGKSLLGQ